jgi:hypothetical protein
MPIPAAEIGKVMQKVLGGITYDHVRSTNSNHGWIARKLEKPRAEDLLAELKSAGHEAIIKDENDLVGVGQVTRIRRAELSQDAMRVEVGLLGELSPLPWDSLSLVSIGRVQVVQKKTVKKTFGIGTILNAKMDESIPVTKMRTTTQTKTQIDEKLLVHLAFSEEGILREMRPNSFDYGYLGDRLQPSGRENFRLFLSDLAKFGGSSTWTRMARNLAEEGESPHTFQGEKDMLRYTEWRVEASFDLG